MNIYFCRAKNHDAGCYVAAETAGKAKALYAEYDGMENYTEYRAEIVRKGANSLQGVYDMDCPELKRYGLGYDLDFDD